MFFWGNHLRSTPNPNGFLRTADEITSNLACLAAASRESLGFLGKLMKEGGIESTAHGHEWGSKCVYCMYYIYIYIHTYCTVYFHVVASIIQNSSVVGFLGISPVRKHGCHGQNMVYGVLSSISYWESLLWGCVCVYIYIYMYLLIDRWPNPFVGKIVYVLTMAHMKQMDTNGSLPQNGATPKSSMFIRFPIINHQSWGIPHFKKPPNTYKYIKHLAPPWTSNTAWVPLTWTVAGRCFLDCVVSVPRLGTESWGCLVGYLRSCILLVGG